MVNPLGNPTRMIKLRSLLSRKWLRDSCVSRARAAARVASRCDWLSRLQIRLINESITFFPRFQSIRLEHRMLDKAKDGRHARMHPFARIHRLSIESRSFCSVARPRRDDGKQKYLRLYKVINLFFQSRAVGLQVVPTCCYRTVLTFLSRRRRDRLVSGSPTSSVSRDNENVLVKQARHVSSQGPARYHNAASITPRFLPGTYKWALD